MGYLHVPDMTACGWAQLHRDLHLEVAREALVLDVRSNGGGYTSQLVAEKLARALTGWVVPRGKQPYTYSLGSDSRSHRADPSGPAVHSSTALAAAPK